MSLESFKKRLDQAFDEIPMLRSEIASECEVKASTLSTWTNIETGYLPKGDAWLKLMLILDREGIDLIWLITDRGRMRRRWDAAAARLDLVEAVLQIEEDELTDAAERLGEPTTNAEPRNPA